MTKQLILLEPTAAPTSRRRQGARSPGPKPTRDFPGRAAEAYDPDPNEFRIDEQTRTIGRAGIAAARLALAEAVQRSWAAGHPVAA